MALSVSSSSFCWLVLLLSLLQPSIVFCTEGGGNCPSTSLQFNRKKQKVIAGHSFHLNVKRCRSGHTGYSPQSVQVVEMDLGSSGAQVIKTKVIPPIGASPIMNASSLFWLTPASSFDKKKCHKYTLKVSVDACQTIDSFYVHASSYLLDQTTGDKLCVVNASALMVKCISWFVILFLGWVVGVRLKGLKDNISRSYIPSKWKMKY